MSQIQAPQPRSGIALIKAYVPGKSGPKQGTVHKLSSNESPLGPSPAALQAYTQTAGPSLALYPDGRATVLREAIALRYGLNAAQIVCGGTGSDELLQLLGSAYLNAGDEAIHTQFGFLVYPIVIASNGATAVVAREHDFVANVDEILTQVSVRTKMVFLANPNNPTGSYLSLREVTRLQQGLPPDVLLVLDGAYAEYVLAEDYDCGIKLVESCSNVVMTRTFSKIFGLAGIRLGWAYCPPAIADVLNRIRGPFNVSAPAIAAGSAAMQDLAFIEKAVAHNKFWLTWLTAEIGKLGLKITPSVANFILIHFADEGVAGAADDFLTARGLILRRVTAYGLPHALRLSVGTEAANRAVVLALKDFMA